VFEHRLVVLALRGQRLDLTATLRLTAALRGALLALAKPPMPDWFSGHAASGGPSREPHMALLPLPFCGSAHADGHLLGVALALPRQVPADQVRSMLGPLLYDAYGEPRQIRVFDGPALDCALAVELREHPPASLNVAAWTGPSRRWATVTPVVLDRHPSGAAPWERAAEVVGAACERIGLPRPIDVLMHPNALHEGVPPARQFAPLMRKHDGGRMAHSHAVLAFDRPVIGPVILGAGRFRGYGLCRPIHAGAADE
jgi:CRISPR-associated protein Csb2